MWISKLAETNDMTKVDAERVFNSVFEMFKDELIKGNDVTINGFGIFKV